MKKSIVKKLTTVCVLFALSVPTSASSSVLSKLPATVAETIKTHSSTKKVVAALSTVAIVYVTHRVYRRWSYNDEFEKRLVTLKEKETHTSFTQAIQEFVYGKEEVEELPPPSHLIPRVATIPVALLFVLALYKRQSIADKVEKWQRWLISYAVISQARYDADELTHREIKKNIEEARDNISMGDQEDLTPRIPVALEMSKTTSFMAVDATLDTPMQHILSDEELSLM